jgi:hypothetical protein
VSDTGGDPSETVADQIEDVLTATEITQQVIQDSPAGKYKVHVTSLADDKHSLHKIPCYRSCYC